MACFALPPVSAVALAGSLSFGGLNAVPPLRARRRYPPSFARLFGKGRQTKTERQAPQNNTMKTDKNSQATTTSGTLLHPEQAFQDNNPATKYEAMLCFTQQNRARVILMAKSLEEAEERASDFHADEIDAWIPFDGEVYVNSVEAITGGQSHE